MELTGIVIIALLVCVGLHYWQVHVEAQKRERRRRELRKAHRRFVRRDDGH